MTETTTTEPAPQPAPGAEIPLHPSDILMHLIVTFLMPMFISATGGDIYFARMAALETVNAYRIRSQADLIAIAQIIAFGLAALGSLSLSMADDLSLSMMLRLRGNANALNRSAEQNRRAIRQRHSDTPAPYQADNTGNSEAPPAPDQIEYEAEIIANLATTRQSVAKILAELPHAKPCAIEAPTAIAMPAPLPTEQQLQAMWAAAMTDVAEEYSSSLPHLPRAERVAASNRAALLSTCARDLLSGAPASVSALRRL
jgi:hypothetical protein